MVDDARIALSLGDITALDVDAIVNAANGELARGAGVCGAIFRAAGPELDAACRALGGCATGDAKLTPGFRARARWIVHAVGPVWHGGSRGEDAQLASAYRTSLALCAPIDVATLAFPSISTGIYGFPIERAANLAVRTVRAWLREHPLPRSVEFRCFSLDDARVYERLLARADS